MNIRLHYILFGLFGIIYVATVDTFFQDKIPIALGLLLLISGLWGTVAKQVLFKIPFILQKYHKIINSILILLGFSISVYKIVL